jgi:hypothetical protein
MSFLTAIVETGAIPPKSANRAAKKRYSELLSQHLAHQVAMGLRSIGLKGVHPLLGGKGER